MSTRHTERRKRTALRWGVIGLTLLFFLTHKLLRPKVEAVGNQHLMAGEIDVDQAGLAGLTIGQVRQRLPTGTEVAMLRRDGSNRFVERDTLLQAGDTLLVAGQPAAIGSLKLAPDLGDIRADRHDFDLVLAYVSRETLVGQRLDRLPLPQDIAHRIVQVRRGDVDLVPTADLVLEYGDQVGVLAAPEHLGKFTAIFGDSVNAEAQFSFMSFGLGMAAGGLLGLVPIPIPGLGTVSLGAAGGVIVAALVFGYLRRLGDPAAGGQHHSAQLRTDPVPGRGGHVLGRAVREQHRPGRAAAAAGRRDPGGGGGADRDLRRLVRVAHEV